MIYWQYARFCCAQSLISDKTSDQDTSYFYVFKVNTVDSVLLPSSNKTTKTHVALFDAGNNIQSNGLSNWHK